MTTPLSPPDLANAVTSFCTLGAGVTTFLLALLVRRQPARWLAVYAALFVTGIPTLGWHGWGGEVWRVADIGTNLLLAYIMQIAVLGDYYRGSFRRRFAVVSGVVNAVAVLSLIREGVTGERSYALDFGEFGGFYMAEMMLILDALAVTGLMVAARRQIPSRAKPLLYIVIACFVVGLGLASAAGETVHGRIWSYHALWHVLGAFGFIFFWAFKHVAEQEMETA